MKKYLLVIFFFSFLFLFWCNKNNNLIEQEEESIIQSWDVINIISWTQSIDDDSWIVLSIQSWGNTAIKIENKPLLNKKESIHILIYGGYWTSWKNIEYDVTWVVIQDLPHWEFKQKSFFAKYEDESITKDLIWHGNMKWNFLYYTFPKVWIKVYFEDDAAYYFLPEFTGKSKLLKYKNNKISYVGDNNYPNDNQFVYVFQKDSNKSLEETIRQDHPIFFQQGCVTKPMQNNQRRHNKEIVNYNDVEVYQIRRAEWNDQCLVDNLGLWMLYFVMRKDRPDTYYMISKIDACAPSCETFTSIELLP